MLPLLVLLVSLLAASSQAERVFYAPEDAEYHFEAFIATFNKQYSNQEEKTARFNVFQENLKKINEKNAMGHAVFGVTQFTDLTKEEFLQQHTGFTRNSEAGCKEVPVHEKGPVPDSLDWRTKNAVTEVKNQKFCGSCWAFSTTGNLEGAYALKHKKLISISEQQLVDCDENDNGCDGGDMGFAILWLKEHGGAMKESDYPYTGKDNTSCKFDKTKAVLQATDCNTYNVTEDQLKQVLAKVGPLAIAVDADDFQTYEGGILECDPNNVDLDHGVLLVGYGTEGGKPYWIIKNSWGKNWGEKGYVRVLMGKNSCNMLAAIISAVVA